MLHDLKLFDPILLEDMSITSNDNNKISRFE